MKRASLHYRMVVENVMVHFFAFLKKVIWQVSVQKEISCTEFFHTSKTKYIFSLVNFAKGSPYAVLKMNKFGLLFLLLVACSTANAQNAYRYRRALKGVSEQWHKLVLPDEIYGKLNVRFSDLRVLGLASDGDTIEASYLLEAARQKEYVRDIDLQQFNKVQNNGRYYYSFKANSEELINFMHLEFGRSNFSWDIQLEGSMDQKSWFTILKNYHILSLHEAHANYSFTDLHFPATSFRYYRISVPSDVDPLFRKALVRHHELDPGVIHAYAPEHF